MENLEKLIFFNIAGLTPLNYKELLLKYKSLKEIKENAVEIKNTSRKDLFKLLDKELTLIKKYKIKVLTTADLEYPSSLKYIDDPPYIIYLKGNIKREDSLSMAVVGCRKPTIYGQMVTEKITSELVRIGFTVVSGLARGIDTITHKVTVEQGGRTIAVLGSGLLNIYPAENRKLSSEIEKNGAVISEFSLLTKPEKFNFPRRNRIISGLALGTLVIEAGELSGALITARFSLEQGREVFAIPGNINSLYSQGTNTLIKSGAKLVQDVTDIIEELKNVLPEEFLNKRGQSELSTVKLTDIENKIFSLLSNEPEHIDDLARKSNVAINLLSSVLINLEIKGFIKQYPGKLFIKT
ncbi:MAG: DNA-processing protein DprA [Candidatus Firestonebacteria bacterium]